MKNLELVMMVESRTGAVAHKLRFPSPLIKPDLRNYRIRLTDWLPLMAHGGRLPSSVSVREHLIHPILFPMGTDGCPVTASCVCHFSQIPVFRSMFRACILHQRRTNFINSFVGNIK
jgi:hypothetical protein